jgi:hypothetical protein
MERNNLPACVLFLVLFTKGIFSTITLNCKLVRLQGFGELQQGGAREQHPEAP